MMTAQTTHDYRYRTRRELFSQAWTAAHDHRVYPKLLLIQLLYVMVIVTFWVLALMGGAAMGWQAHRLDQFVHYGNELNGTLMWSVMSTIFVDLFGVIGLYAALNVIRHGGKAFNAASEVVQALHWRYVVGFICLSIVRSVIYTFGLILGLSFSVFAIAAHQNMAVVVLIVTASTALGLYLMCWVLLTYSQAALVMRDRINDGGDWTVFTVMRESRHLMRGYRFDLVQLYLSMWWLYLIDVVTLGIGLLFTTPIVNLAGAAFYDNRVRFAALKQEMKM